MAYQQIEQAYLADDVFHICESGIQAYNVLMPEDLYKQLQTCILRFIQSVSFGDNYEFAFNL